LELLGSKHDEQEKLKVVILQGQLAKEVLLGDFNNWDPQTAPMKKDGQDWENEYASSGDIRIQVAG
jgi:hypothetical protein